MSRFGIYIAKFNKRVLDKQYKNIENAYVIGEVNLEADKYKDFSEIPEVIKDRILDEARRNNGKKGFYGEIKNWTNDVIDSSSLSLEDSRKNVDDRIRKCLVENNLGKQIPGTEFFIPNKDIDSAEKIRETIEEVYKQGNIESTKIRKDKWEFYDFQRKIIEQAKEKLATKNELLLYLFCRVGKSAISLEIARQLTKTNRILILTSFPNSRASFAEYTKQHVNMAGYKFVTKNDLNENKVSSNDKVVAFLSTAALRIKDDDKESFDTLDVDLKNEDDAVTETYKRIEELKNLGEFDFLVIDETHNGITSDKTSKLIEKCKESLNVQKIIHNSATPFNDFRSSRFTREDTIQLDFLTILNNYNEEIKFPNLELHSLPYYDNPKNLVTAILKSKGNHKLLYLANDSKTCKKFVEEYKEYFKKKGVELEYIDNLRDGDTTEEKAVNFEDSYKKTILVTCDKLHTGVTLPRCDSVLLNRDLSSAERLIQVMSRCLSRCEGKDEVYFYTLGSDNVYRAVSELKRNYNAAQDNQLADAFSRVIGSKIKVKNDTIVGDDIDEYNVEVKEVMERVSEWSLKLENFERQISLEGTELYTEEDLKKLDEYTSSGISKIENTILDLFKQKGKRVSDVKQPNLKDALDSFQDYIEKEGGRKEKVEKEEATIEETLRKFFVMVLRSLNTWLLMKEVENFEDVGPYVISKLNMNPTASSIFSVMLDSNSRQIKEFITSHNEIYHLFHKTSLKEKADTYSKKLRSHLTDFNFESGDIGGGYPEKVANDMLNMSKVPANGIVAILDDIYLEMTNKLLSPKYNLNESNLYFICHKEELKELFEKAYCIAKDHVILYNEMDTHMKKMNKDFDLILSNPPYGKNNTLSKKIASNLLNYTDRLALLSPKNVYKDEQLWSKVEEIQLVDSTAFDASIMNLSSAILRRNFTNSSSFEELCLTEKQIELLRAIKSYNETHEVQHNLCGFKCKAEGKIDRTLEDAAIGGICDYLKPIKDMTLRECKDTFRAFVITQWTPSNGVHTQESQDWNYNLYNKWDSKYNEMIPFNLMIFKTKQERDNFKEWWYSCLEREKERKSRSGLTNMCLSLIRDTRGGTSLCYDLYFPHLDWTRKWTDTEVLVELGLPEDFLDE